MVIMMRAIWDNVALGSAHTRFVYQMLTIVSRNAHARASDGFIIVESTSPTALTTITIIIFLYLFVSCNIPIVLSFLLLFAVALIHRLMCDI